MHTLDLPLGNRTPDADIIALTDREKRAVITKDEDFLHSFLVEGRPAQLLLVTTGNIGNAELESIIRSTLGEIVQAFVAYRLVELTRTALVIHE